MILVPRLEVFNRLVGIEFWDCDRVPFPVGQSVDVHKGITARVIDLIGFPVFVFDGNGVVEYPPYSYGLNPTLCTFETESFQSPGLFACSRNWLSFSVSVSLLLVRYLIPKSLKCFTEVCVRYIT